jgi:hypothetical protein
MNKIVTILFTCSLVFLYVLCLIGCSVPDNPKTVKIWALRGDSVVYVRVENLSNKSYFFPESYNVQYLPDSDTAHFESVYKSEYDLKKLYFYSKFSEPIITPIQLADLSYDSVKTTKFEVSYFQFQPPKLIEVKPHGIFNYKIPIKLPVNIQLSDFKIYKENYIPNSKKNYELYHSYDNFIKYEAKCSSSFCVKLYPAIK